MADNALSHPALPSSAARYGSPSLRVWLARQLRQLGLTGKPPLSWATALLDPIAADGEARRARNRAAALEETLESLCDDLGQAQARVTTAECRARSAVSDRQVAINLVRDLQDALHTTRSLWTAANPGVPPDIAKLHHRYGLLPSCPDHILDAAEAAQIAAWRLSHPSTAQHRLAARLAEVERDFAAMRQHRQALHLQPTSQSPLQEATPA